MSSSSSDEVVKAGLAQLIKANQGQDLGPVDDIVLSYVTSILDDLVEDDTILETVGHI